MKHNMGTADRIIRALFAVVILALFLTKSISGIAAIILGVIAIVLLLTSLVGVCPAYLPMKWSTCKTKAKE